MLVLLKATIWLIIIIGLVIFIHELGHFLAAKMVGITVEEFAIGFGKALISKKFKGTIYKFNAIPYGGYVKLLGEEEESDKPGSFSTKPLPQKILVIIGGVVMNFLLAVVVFYIVLALNDFIFIFPKYAEQNFIGADVEVYTKPYVDEVIEGTPADEVDFPVNSIIWKIDEIDIQTIEEFQDYLRSHEGQEISLELLKFSEDEGQAGEWVNIKVTPRKTSEEGVLLGVKFGGGVALYYQLDYSGNKVLSGLSHSLNYTAYNLNVLGELIKMSFAERTVKPVAEGVGGVVGLANTTLDLVKLGDITDILSLMAGVNISIAIMNMLPFPALDGGYVFILLFEKLTGKKIPEKYLDWAVKIGLTLLILLIIAITVKDVIQFDVIPRIGSFIKNLF